MVMFGKIGGNLRAEFDRRVADKLIDDLLERDAVAVRGASIEAVVDTTNEVKERLRDYLDAFFVGSQVIGGRTGRSRRRVSFASAQSKFYNDIAEKGQYTGLIYSKFGRGHGPTGFVDYLLLHLRGGSVRPKRGDWIRIPNRKVNNASFGFNAQVGDFPLSNSRIFFKKAPGGRKMFLLRESFGFGRGRRKEDRKVELLATLVRGLNFAPRLTGLDQIAASRADLFEGKFRKALEDRITD